MVNFSVLIFIFSKKLEFKLFTDTKCFNFREYIETYKQGNTSFQVLSLFKILKKLHKRNFKLFSMHRWRCQIYTRPYNKLCLNYVYIWIICLTKFIIWRADYFLLWFHYKSELSTARKCKEWTELNTVKPRKRWYLLHYWSDKEFSI